LGKKATLKKNKIRDNKKGGANSWFGAKLKFEGGVPGRGVRLRIDIQDAYLDDLSIGINKVEVEGLTLSQ